LGIEADGEYYYEGVKSMEELKPCPFCGSKAKLVGECDMVWARRTNYDCMAERINKFDESEETIEDWNKRKGNELIAKLTHIIQRLEREGVDLTVNDIKTVWRAKKYLGYSTPETLEDGTGQMVRT
jgi:hypothetical protein